MSGRLTFHGAAGTVTGARFLVETPRARLLVDCGLFQGEVRQRNWEPLAVEASSVGAVVLSHAHIDHSGYLPRLVRAGFGGPVFCSPGTADLLRILLPDAAGLEEEEAEFRNRTGATRHHPALPLFTAADAERALTLLRPVEPGQSFAPAPGVAGRFRRAGHILGAAIVGLELDGHRLVYSGDLGRYGVPVMRDPERVEAADTLLVESTYGDRDHPGADPDDALAAAVERAVGRRGLLLVPAFAVGRVQELLYRLRELEAGGRIPRLPVYLDSPMAIAATAAYARHPGELDEDLGAAAGGRPFAPARLHLVPSPAESRRLNDLEGPAVIIAGSGMATGGRILHHLRHHAGDERTTVLLVGYQAAGTRGRLLRDGARRLRIFGEEVPIRAEVRVADGLSAHADRGEILRWLAGFARPPRATWIVHGEPEPAAALAGAIGDRLGWEACRVAAHGHSAEL